MPQDMEASVPRYIRPLCLTESQSEGDGRKKGGEMREKMKKKRVRVRRELFGFWSLGVRQASARTALLEMCALWWGERWQREIWM